MKKTIKLTPELLKRIVKEEAAKFGEMEPTEDRAKDAEETDADEMAGTLGKHIDMMKALKIEEARLSKRLKRVQERKGHLLKLIERKI